MQVYDIETYPNAFTACFKTIGGPGVYFEISNRRQDNAKLIKHILARKALIGFNCMAFDWPVLNHLLEHPNATAFELYQKAQDIIASNDRYASTIWRPIVPQIDLFLIHHFNNRAKSTSLKKLEFNMRSTLVQDLPFPVGTTLNDQEIDILLQYNAHDVCETERFYGFSLARIELRQSIDPAWINQSDSGLGRKYFERELKLAGVPTHDDEGNPITTHYPDGVNVGSVVFDYLKFPSLEAEKYFNSIVVKDVVGDDGEYQRFVSDDSGNFTFELDGLKVAMGMGGMHASVKSKIYEPGHGYKIMDFDVTSFYTNLAIKNKLYPQHLGPQFYCIYESLLERRLKFAKGTKENKVLKDALNSVFGSSGSHHTCFCDLRYLLSTTINGQLLVYSLAKHLLGVPGVHLIQINTDGVTVCVPDEQATQVNFAAAEWSKCTRMPLEGALYTHMWIRDVNNYIAQFLDGSRKRKGAYAHSRDWWQNHSAMVVPKVTEGVMCDGCDAMTLLQDWPDPWDFLMRLDLRRPTHVMLEDGSRLDGVVRYYVSTEGHQAVKHTAKTKSRIHGGGHAEAVGKRGNWTCTACGKTFSRKKDCETHMDENHASSITIVQQYKGEPINPDLRYYAKEVNKLVLKDVHV